MPEFPPEWRDPGKPELGATKRDYIPIALVLALVVFVVVVRLV